MFSRLLCNFPLYVVTLNQPSYAIRCASGVNAVIETDKIPCFVWKEKKIEKINFIRGVRKLKGTN